ncbi:MAG: putative LpqP (hydrolase/esterase) [Frankiales bacterium]|nr:putative LpqP (hydrolase/esterase) [Frankiales bacterium]
MTLRCGLRCVSAALTVAGLLGAGAVSGMREIRPAALAGVSRLTVSGVSVAGMASALRTAPVVRRTVRWTSGGRQRALIEVAPRTSHGRLPLVIVLHGRRQTASRAERTQHWDQFAGAGRAVIVYGAGYGGSWNAGSCCGPAQGRHIDDVRYLLQVITREEKRPDVDPRRVLLVGFSNGGMLAFRFACEHPGLLSGLAVVEGSLQVPTCRPAVPLSVLDVEGDRDRVVPYLGSRFSAFAGAATTSLSASLRPWRRRDEHTSCTVTVIRLPRLGHDWPSLSRGGWDATTHVWGFFSRLR